MDGFATAVTVVVIVVVIIVVVSVFEVIFVIVEKKFSGFVVVDDLDPSDTRIPDSPAPFGVLQHNVEFSAKRSNENVENIQGINASVDVENVEGNLWTLKTGSMTYGDPKK